MTDQIKIRLLKRQDISFLIAMNAKLYDAPSKNKKLDSLFFEKFCFGKNRLADVFVAIVDKKTIGFIHSYDWASFGGRIKVRHIAHLFVEEKFRGCGVGTALINYVKMDAVKTDCVRIDVDALSQEKRANKFYKKFGFQSNPQKKNSYRHYF